MTSETGTATRVWTAGYQGEELEGFIQKLRGAGITMVVDVRRRAQSFSKTALHTALNEADIEYEHLRYLGMSDDLMPKRNAEDNTDILEEFRRRLEADPAVLDELRGLVAAHRVCLLCFEADYQQCHRRVIADLLGVETTNL